MKLFICIQWKNEILWNVQKKKKKKKKKRSETSSINPGFGDNLINCINIWLIKSNKYCITLDTDYLF